MSTTANVEGHTVKVGDSVSFKSDIEQRGTITKITRDINTREVRFHLHNENGFEGEYLQYDTDTVVDASDCWID